MKVMNIPVLLIQTIRNILLVVDMHVTVLCCDTDQIYISVYNSSSHQTFRPTKDQKEQDKRLETQPNERLISYNIIGGEMLLFP